ncbi:SemiSWEET transporter [candidate division KSB1 bacterium]|nr:SemiSWEET transporter [candidate division KSB1 bacterium]
MTSHTLATILGSIAAVCTTIAFLPQAIKTIKTKHTKDLSLSMYTLLNLGIFLWFCYGILIKEVPVILANGITWIFTMTILALIIKYK